jgi:hypothetical protein
MTAVSIAPAQAHVLLGVPGVPGVCWCSRKRRAHGAPWGENTAEHRDSGPVFQGFPSEEHRRTPGTPKRESNRKKGLNWATGASRTRAGACGAPVAAGLVAHCVVVFCDAVPGAGCPAWIKRTARPLLEGVAGDGLVLCVDCGHWHPGRCRNHWAAGLAGFELAAGWHELPQQCAGFWRAREAQERPMHGNATENAPRADSGPAWGIHGEGWR